MIYLSYYTVLLVSEQEVVENHIIKITKLLSAYSVLSVFVLTRTVTTQWEGIKVSHSLLLSDALHLFQISGEICET